MSKNDSHNNKVYGKTTCIICKNEISMKEAGWMDHLRWYACEKCRKEQRVEES